MLTLVGVSRSYGGRAAVQSATFTVAPGEVVALLGPNGAGKTTVMRMLAGLLRQEEGAVSAPARIGYLPEVFAAYDALSVRRYLAFIARAKRAERSDVGRVLVAAGVDDLARRPVGRLSKGQRQRVGIAQALLGRPPAYVLDEPTQGLDPGQVVDARAVVRACAREEGAAVLISTHLLLEAAATCDRVVVIARGRVVADERPGAVADLEARYLSLVAQSELAAANLL